MASAVFVVVADHTPQLALRRRPVTGEPAHGGRVNDVLEGQVYGHALPRLARPDRTGTGEVRLHVDPVRPIAAAIVEHQYHRPRLVEPVQQVPGVLIESGMARLASHEG